MRARTVSPYACILHETGVARLVKTVEGRRRCDLKGPTRFPISQWAIRLQEEFKRKGKNRRKEVPPHIRSSLPPSKRSPCRDEVEGARLQFQGRGKCRRAPQAKDGQALGHHMRPPVFLSTINGVDAGSSSRGQQRTKNLEQRPSRGATSRQRAQAPVLRQSSRPQEMSREKVQQGRSTRYHGPSNRPPRQNEVASSTRQVSNSHSSRNTIQQRQVHPPQLVERDRRSSTRNRTSKGPGIRSRRGQPPLSNRVLDKFDHVIEVMKRTDRGNSQSPI
ncbi:hypothetical protein AUEXF2481DRAFT_344410 [Aureobasidium subglaciale EXF-2481]|uniref:Uncharacterized protein n=1 Tax=Aureobasidium subglaciale (strain EXF-2481) TaxID=1043005 RepID=A0A074Z300_AURSE|nr:uncharacterized protein AUEXF2481DRAFT_344410 [Aureobasidium subglaciale EXF-2481]KEQ93436.1 hypothetical protein AUEXF2481DRAFT_344410 [Aureobasidium subglaciale EXF-2481]